MRHVAPVVAKALLLLERRVVLLVDDQHRQPRHRREQRRARADGQPQLAAPQRAPGVVALAIAQPAVQHRDALAEARPKARHELRRERDLRHQHQRAAVAARARCCHDLQVDLGLAGAGDAVQQERARLARRTGAPTASRWRAPARRWPGTGGSRGQRRGEEADRSRSRPPRTRAAPSRRARAPARARSGCACASSVSSTSPRSAEQRQQRALAGAEAQTRDGAPRRARGRARWSAR